MTAGQGRLRCDRARTGPLPVIVLTTVVALITSGCSGGLSRVGSGSDSPSSPSTAPAVAAGGGVRAALETSARQVRSLVDSLARPLQVGGSARQVTVDDAGPCLLGEANPWPQRWGYGLSLSLRSRDVVDDVSDLRRQLGSDGWALREYPATPESVDFDARKDGVLLRVSGEPNPARVVIEGYGVCLDADGSRAPDPTAG